MDIKRLILFVIFSFSILMVWDSWQRQHAPVVAPMAQSETTTAPANVDAKSAGVFKLNSTQRIKVSTDLYSAEIDTTGGDLRRLVLNKQLANDIKEGNFVLMDDAGKPMIYVAQTGLNGNDLPNENSQFTSLATEYKLAEGASSQEVRLSWSGNGVSVDKIYTFYRDSYVVDVRYEINNGSANSISPTAYYQIVHDNKSYQGSKMMVTFTGGAYYTEADKFKKIKFSDMTKENLSKISPDGWIGLVQHYFGSAWVPQANLTRNFYTKQLTPEVFAIGVSSPAVNIAAGAKVVLDAKLFAGPQTKLKEADSAANTTGLETLVDYGWLTIIARPLFWLLSHIHALVNNWGIAIILLTVLMKAAFFKLSATGYRSSAQMRELAPRLQAMKEKFGDDKQKMQQSMMELYKKEKINPISGCLPILMQMPVFIALYWMLSAVVELRHAPFFGWIQDLSAKDPYYILPVLMGITMIIQTKLNPKPTDPVQAKVMQIMPVVFSVFFFFFPAGLVLYWLVNNILSIWQQWYINKTIHAAAIEKKSGKK